MKDYFFCSFTFGIKGVADPDVVINDVVLSEKVVSTVVASDDARELLETEGTSKTPCQIPF